jgi:phytoene synthase
MDTRAQASDVDLQACHELMRGGSKTFFAASRVLPARVRAPAAALYAFCRVADDAIDLSDDRPSALADLERRLDAVYAGAPRPIVADRALAFVVGRAGIPKPLLDALLEGFAWDAQGRRYETLEDLHAYAARVAGTVGAMMSIVMATRTPAALARACELGVAMQLTNIARDVGEDARAGRLYLPLQWLREEGIDPDGWLSNPVFGPGIARVVQRLLQAAEDLYARAEKGVAELPRDCRPAIQAARLVYAEIGREVQAAGADSVNHRAVVSGRRKLALLARASAAAVVAPGLSWRSGAGLLPLAAIRYLVDAAAMPVPPDRSFYGRTVRMIEMFEAVAWRKRERERKGYPHGGGVSRGQPYAGAD